MGKRTFDLVIAFLAFLLLMPLLLPVLLIAAIDTRSSGIFLHKRVGRYGSYFKVVKFRTMHSRTGGISRVGNWLRTHKIDELPQLLNIIVGQMSFVGPRPDVPGYYDRLVGEERKILHLRPGLTSDASLRFYDEENLLKKQDNPLVYNDQVIFPEKVKLNLEYYYRRSFRGDLYLIFRSIFRKLN